MKAPTKVKRRDRKLNWKALEQHIKDEPDAKLKDRAVWEILKPLK